MRELATIAIKKFVRIRPEIMQKYARYYSKYFGAGMEVEGKMSKSKTGKLRRKKGKMAKEPQSGGGKGKVLGVHIRGTDKNWGGEILK
jgi:hypothetical protein